MVNMASVILAVDMARAGQNTVLGIGIVFCVLILISFIISLLKLVNRPEKPKAVVETPAAVAPVVEEEDVTDDLEIVAVITAAIEAYEEAMGGYVPADGLVVRSIKKRNKQNWLNA